MNTRRVLREFTVKDGVFLHEGFSYGNLGGVRAYLPDGTKAELAVYVDSPPKRELVTPTDAVWQRDMLDRKMSWCLSHHTMGIVGKVTQPLEINNDWHAVVFQEDGNHEHLLCGSEIEAKRFIYEHLADTNTAGFSWKTPEPDWSRYECVTAWRRYADRQWRKNSTLFPNIADIGDILDYHEQSKKGVIESGSVNLALIEGRLPDGSVEIIDRWEKGKKE